MPVTLIVKAPNQQIEDQTVRCELNWTIKKLKGYLSEVYPSKPRTEDQKLIYSGQLLHDTVILKDILRCYEGQEKHTVHLVCSPSRDVLKTSSSHSAKMNSGTHQPHQHTVSRNDQNTTSSEETSQSNSAPNSNDGLRHRTNDSHVTWDDPQMMWGIYADQRTPWSTNNLYNQADFAQQMAWMQQAYAQYMTQYMQLMTSGSMTSGLTSLQVPPSTSPSVTPAPQLAQQPEREEPVGANDIVQNGGGGEEEEVRANRDWLDWFYFASRSLVLFSIVYFYSSPVRFFFVSTLGIIMYLYQVGFFRAAGGQAVAVAEPQAAAAGAGVGPAPVPPVENNNTTPETSSSGEASPAPRQVDRPSLLTLTWSIFSSFFLSLIPERPNVT